jgi:hypothetical protein
MKVRTHWVPNPNTHYDTAGSARELSCGSGRVSLGRIGLSAVVGLLVPLGSLTVVNECCPQPNPPTP